MFYKNKVANVHIHEGASDAAPGGLQARSSGDPACLPQDLLIQLAGYVDPWDLVRFRRVSRRWEAAFSDVYLIRRILKQEFENVREVCTMLTENTSEDRRYINTNNQVLKLFDRLSCRYYHLTNGKPRSVSQIALADASVRGPILYSVGPLDLHRSREAGVANDVEKRLFEHAFWSYDDGFLVYPSKEHECLVAMSLESEQISSVPFQSDGKIVRNLRIKSGLLAIEWAEAKAFHALNDSEFVHRHFATLYRISIPHESAPPTITFHSEFKLHFLGLPLTERDRFFSTHTSDHYAVYFWQPNRSMYTGDEENPIESLIVFNISTPSPYLPSLDPTSVSRPSSKGPSAILSLSFRDLFYFGIRQRSSPGLMSLRIDSDAKLLEIYENIKDYTAGYFDPADRSYRSSITGIPFEGYFPHHYISDPLLNLPPYMGNCSMESDEDLWDQSETWFENWFNVIDRRSGVMFSLTRTMFKGIVLGGITDSREGDAGNWSLIRVRAMGREKSMDEKWAKLVIGTKGKLAGDERWLIGEAEGMLNVLRFN